MSNADRVREIIALADAMDVEALVERFADDAVMELPFAPGRMPKLYEGRDAIAGFQRFARDAFSSFSMTLDAVYETADPHVVIAEHRSNGIVAENGRSYRNRYCTVFTFDDAGRIAGWREFYDAGVVVAVFRPER